MGTNVGKQPVGLRLFQTVVRRLRRHAGKVRRGLHQRKKRRRMRGSFECGNDVFFGSPGLQREATGKEAKAICAVSISSSIVGLVGPDFFFLKGEEKNMKTSTNLFLGNPFKQIVNTLKNPEKISQDISRDLENKCNNHAKDGYFLIPRGDSPFLMGLGARCPPNTKDAYFDANYCKGSAARMIGNYTYSHSYTSQPDCRPSKNNKLVYWKPLYKKNGKPDKESCGLPTDGEIKDIYNKKTARFRGYNSSKWGGDLQCGSCYRYTGSRHRMDCK